jgi:hypothetical protein
VLLVRAQGIRRKVMTIDHGQCRTPRYFHELQFACWGDYVRFIEYESKLYIPIIVLCPLDALRCSWVISIELSDLVRS